jgi:hypothetical protein
VPAYAPISASLCLHLWFVVVESAHKQLPAIKLPRRKVTGCHEACIHATSSSCPAQNTGANHHNTRALPCSQYLSNPAGLLSTGSSSDTDSLMSATSISTALGGGDAEVVVHAFAHSASRLEFAELMAGRFWGVILVTGGCRKWRDAWLLLPASGGSSAGRHALRD